jgi:hypothetical protein
MLHPQSKSGTPTTRPGEAPASPARAGQVPSGERPLARLCILSVPVRVAADGGLEAEANAAEWRRLAGLGFGVALGLDPAERAELGWNRLRELARRAGGLGLAQGFVAGVSNEPAGSAATIGDQLDAVVQQASEVEEAGGIPLILPLAALSRRRCKESEYVELYRALLARLGGPVLLDWTGPKLRPELLDYFPGQSFERVLALEPAKVRGARFALLDTVRESRLRRELLARDQLLLTADVGHLGALLRGANPGIASDSVQAPVRSTELAGRVIALGDFSHALLGGLAPRAEVLAQALAHLAAGEGAAFLARLAALDERR